MNRWVVGVDFGQRSDRTAVAAIEVVPFVPTEEAPFPKPQLQVRWLHRYPVGMDYPTQCALLAGMLDGTPELERAEVIVDATGVGVAVVDTLREHLRRPFTELSITGGSKAKTEGHRRSVPKRDLVSRLAVVLQQRRLWVSPTMTEAPVLRAELDNFAVNISDNGSDTFGAKSGHDDLVLALSYAVWLTELPSQGTAFLEHMKNESIRHGIAVPRNAQTWRDRVPARAPEPPRFRTLP